MKTKELIAQLNQNDPFGEEEVCVDNIDIWYVDRLPSYWDGSQEVLIRDESRSDFNILGTKIKRSGDKILIRTISAEDVIWNNPEAILDLSDPYINEDRKKEYTDKFDEIRIQSRKIEEDIKNGK